MKDSFQDLLLFIPFNQLKFPIPLPKDRLYFEKISEELPGEWLAEATLITIMQEEELERLNSKEVANQLIQDPNLIGIVICTPQPEPLGEEILALFLECQLPIVQVTNPMSLQVFYEKEPLFFAQLSEELVGSMEDGLPQLLSELGQGLGTPFLYLDENEQLLWQMGNEEELRDANRWLNVHCRELEEIKGSLSGRGLPTRFKKEEFELYPINIAGIIRQGLLASATLVDWQRRMVDKLVGLMALLLQAEGMFQEQQRKLQEHFVYDLLYHKFESQKVMIKQAKTWGWNLEIPHHLLLIAVKVSDDLMDNINWLEEMVLLIEETKTQLEKTLIVFPFQDQIVVLLEDGEKRTNSERMQHVMEVAKEIEKCLSSQWSDCQISVGIGKWYENMTFLNKSYQEANQALKFGQLWLENRKVFHINDLGILRLLIHIHQEILSDFSQEYLSVLIESDKENGTDFINTLEVYIQHQGIINEVSDALYIHPNTLRNRIKKIEEMVWGDLENPEEFMNLMIALKIRSFINQ